MTMTNFRCDSSSPHLQIMILLLLLSLLTLCNSQNSQSSQTSPPDGVIPESQCEIYRNEIANCTTTLDSCSSTCPPFALTDQDSKGICSSGSLVGIYCFQYKDYITCCPECKTAFDEMAGCMLGTGRVIDDTECNNLCSSGGNRWLTMFRGSDDYHFWGGTVMVMVSGLLASTIVA